MYLYIPSVFLMNNYDTAIIFVYTENKPLSVCLQIFQSPWIPFIST